MLSEVSMSTNTSSSEMEMSLAQYVDVRMFYATLILFGIGITMAASTTVEMSYKDHADALYYIKKQLVFVAFGLFSLFFVSRIRLVYWEKLGPLMLVASIALLALVLVPGIGRSVNGSSRWLAIGPVGLQISEFAKVAMIVYLAGYIVRHEPRVQTKFGAFLNPLVILGVIVILLLLEPDFGSAVVFVITVFAMLYLGGVRFTPFLLFTAFSFIALVLLAISSPYRLERISSFLDPWADPFDTGFQLTQALIAIGNGGVFGVGIGESVQKLFYLPEAHNDFVFAVLAEEMGLIGVVILLTAYFVLIWRCFALGSKAQSLRMTFAQNLAYGLSLIHI